MRGIDEVVTRACALSAMYVRARVEGGLKYSSGEHLAKWRALGEHLQRWCRDADLSPTERERLRRPLASWAEQVRIDAEWRLEAVGALGWALSLTRLPAWDRSRCSMTRAIAPRLGIGGR